MLDPALLARFLEVPGRPHRNGNVWLALVPKGGSSGVAFERMATEYDTRFHAI